MLCLAVLAHDNEQVLANQIENLRFYNPNALIVLYNGGVNPDYGSGSGAILCPYSRPLVYGKLTRYLFDVMRWLEETQTDYDYLVSVDSDVMFVNHGYESFLNQWLQEYDCMGVNMGIQRSPSEVPHWVPGQMLWREWDWWQPFFKTDGFCGTLNPMQVYTRRIIRRLLPLVDVKLLERLLQSTEVFALEEMLHATLAVAAGGKPIKYPTDTAAFTRCGDSLSLAEVKQARRSSNVFFVHPVHRDMADPARQWITAQSCRSAT